ncbi:MAG TPA: IPT/TIG domain-containing protein [Polyangiaceae bacterium]
MVEESEAGAEPEGCETDAPVSGHEAPEAEPEALAPEPVASESEALPPEPEAAPEAEALAAEPETPAEERRLPAPAMTAIRPTLGPMSGGTRVVVDGAGFAEGCEVKVGGVPVTAERGGDTSLAFTTLARNVAGQVDVDVVNPDGQRTLLLRCFEYCAPPTLMAIAPDHAAETGGGRATVTGTGFRAGTEVRVGASRPPVTIVSATQLEVELLAHPAGAFDVEVIAPDGQEARLIAAFHFDAPPKLARIVPDRVALHTATRAVVEGSDFRAGCVVYFGGARVAAELESSDRLAVSLPARDTPGPVALRIQNPDGSGAELADGFHVEAAPGPRVTAIVPAFGPRGREVFVAIEGEHFDEGCSVRVGGVVLPARVLSPARIEVHVPASDVAGFVDVDVRALDGRSSVLSGAFEVRGGPMPMTVAPREGSSAGGTSVEVQGAGFASGCAVSFGGSPGTTEWVSETMVRTIVPARSGGAGAVDVAVTNPDGQTAALPAAFVYVAGIAPVVKSVAPTVGPTTGGTPVVVRGEHLDAAALVLFGGQQVKKYQARGEELSFVAPARTREGVADLELRTADGTVVVRKSVFEYKAVPAPVIKSVTPNRIATGGGTEVTIAGDHFFPGATVLVAGEPAPTVKVRDATTIVFKAPPGDSGSMADVAVRSATGQEAVAKRAVLYDPRYR